MKRRNLWKKASIQFCLLCIVLFLCACGREEYIPSEHLKDPIVRVDGRDLTLEDIAFLILDTESTVQEQAVAYDPQEPVKYWRAHVNGKFINLVAKEGIIKTAVHDEIFYRMALRDQVSLKEEEKEMIREKAGEYFKNLSTYQKEALDLEESDIRMAMEKIGLAEKYEILYMVEQKCNPEDLTVDGEVYRRLLEEHEYKIHIENWGEVPVGMVTIWGNEL